VLGHRSWDQRQERRRRRRKKYPNCIKWVCFFGLWHEHSTLCTGLIGHAKKEKGPPQDQFYRPSLELSRTAIHTHNTYTVSMDMVFTRDKNMGFSMRVSFFLFSV
jgi:hypothetical protein